MDRFVVDLSDKSLEKMRWSWLLLLVLALLLREVDQEFELSEDFLLRFVVLDIVFYCFIAEGNCKTALYLFHLQDVANETVGALRSRGLIHSKDFAEKTCLLLFLTD
jgi:hypothetical protein